MIHLFKYDVKKNATLLSAGAIILLAGLAAILTVGKWKDWGFITIYTSSIMLIIMTGVLGFVLVCNTYRKNITSYSRRLLPLPSVYAAITPFAMLIGIELALIGVYVLYDAVLASWGGFEATLLQIAKENITASGWFSILFTIIWFSVCLTALLFFSMTVTETIKGKGGAWLGITVFFGIAAGLSMLQAWLFPSSNGGGDTDVIGFQILEENGTATVSFGGLDSINWASFALDAVIVVLLLAGISYLLNRKVKV
ncbi:hypothetical protein A7K91_05930 [Paenibacillus oryzae]|uniref:Uncharacterized protein n=1 Tax=Paenibacillus oryzae TaxID=1844972 RepID=A0A1A5YHP4_9BACL|nr:hypothetical protein [Paenibacillus oryzae]OBR65094.1 hypothetical protein A7K91_05930 [Paenibacillus oryzae]